MRMWKKPTEFFQMIVVWVMMLTTVATIASYILAACGYETCIEIAEYFIEFGVKTLIAYGGKSLAEKALRDIYGLDRDGRPWSLMRPEKLKTEEDEEETGG